MDVGRGGQGVNQMPLRLEGVPAVDQVHVGADVGQEQGVLQGGVAPAHHRRVPAPEEVAVAGGAVAHAPAGQPLLAGHLQLPAADAVGDDHRPALIGVSAGGHGLVCALVGQGGHPLKADVRAQGLGLLVEVHGEVRPGDLLAARPVLNVRRGGRLAAGGAPLQQQGGVPGPLGVDGGGQARRAGADDNDVVHMLTSLTRIIPV